MRVAPVYGSPVCRFFAPARRSATGLLVRIRISQGLASVSIAVVGVSNAEPSDLTGDMPTGSRTLATNPPPEALLEERFEGERSHALRRAC